MFSSKVIIEISCIVQQLTGLLLSYTGKSGVLSLECFYRESIIEAPGGSVLP